MSIEELIQLCPPPVSPVANEGDWWDVEEELGTSLPEDYKHLVGVYGAGTFGDFIVVLSPFRETRERGLLARFGSWRTALRASPGQVSSYVPPPVFPEQGGVLPWGVTDNGDLCCWLTTSDSKPGRWTIAINESRGPEWFHAPVSLTSFLAEAVTGRMVVSVFPDDFPEPGVPPSFRPVATS